MKYSKIFLPVLLVFLFSCRSAEEKDTTISARHGGMLKINIPDFSWNFNPHTITEQEDYHIAAQIYDGLLKYNPRNLTITPAIAKYWVFGDEGKTYTFYLRTNAYFHKNECFKTPEKTRRITAHDVKYSIEKFCNYCDEREILAVALRDIVGAEEYFKATKNLTPEKGIRGIKVVNDSVLEIRIKQANSLFINSFAELNLSVVPKEAIEMYNEEIYVGSGPFYLKQKPVQSDKLMLYRNENYFFDDYEAYPLPYFDSIEVNFINSAEKEIQWFEQGKLDIIFNVPATTLPAFIEKHGEKFKGENPEYVLVKDEAGGLQPTYILHHTYLMNFATNRHNFIDYTRVYFEKKTN